MGSPPPSPNLLSSQSSGLPPNLPSRGKDGWGRSNTCPTSPHLVWPPTWSQGSQLRVTRSGASQPNFQQPREAMCVGGGGGVRCYPLLPLLPTLGREEEAVSDFSYFGGCGGGGGSQRSRSHASAPRLLPKAGRGPQVQSPLAPTSRLSRLLWMGSPSAVPSSQLLPKGSGQRDLSL